MKKDTSAVHLTASSFLASSRDGLNQQVASARWELILALKRVLPEFFGRLRGDVYPAYARLAKENSDYWRTGRSFSMWQSRSDRDRELTPILMSWARRFNVDEDTWILEGALQTLSNWHKFPRCREKTEVLGFRKPVCVSGLISDSEHSFEFKDDGWDPTLMSFDGWRANVRERFKAALEQHRRQLQTLVQQRGGLPAAVRASRDHFEWLALYHCGNASLETIQARARLGDKSTISKGVHHAAELALMRVRTKRRKLRSH